MSSAFPPPPSDVFEHRERVRWSDCDPLGIIFYGAYVRILEAAEHECFRACGLPYDELRVRKGVWLPRKAFRIEFHAPAAMDELLAIHTWFSRVGTTSLTLRFEVLRAEDLAPRASAELTVVSVDKGTIAKRPLPDFVKAAIARYTAPPTR